MIPVFSELPLRSADCRTSFAMGKLEFSCQQGMLVRFEQVLQDPRRLAAIAESCRRTALTEYKLDVQAKRYMALYESLLPAGTDSAKPVFAR